MLLSLQFVTPAPFAVPFDDDYEGDGYDLEKPLVVEDILSGKGMPCVSTCNKTKQRKKYLHDKN